MSVSAHSLEHDAAFRHEALIYSGHEEFVEEASAFLREGVALGEPALVVVSAAKIRDLREALGGDADGVVFADMAHVGANPSRIIPAWRDFVAAHPGERLRGIGEPVYPERRADELAECQQHEALLNVAFDGGQGWWLVCPYDTESLADAVIEEAYRSHPLVRTRSGSLESRLYPGMGSGSLQGALPEPSTAPFELRFDRHSLRAVRWLVSREAARAGLEGARIADAALAIDEVAANTVRHGAGEGVLRVWREPAELVCEVRDRGTIDQPLAGRVRPAGPDLRAGRGLWLVNQLCDLVQIRSSGAGTVVRLHLRRERPGGARE